MEPELVDIARQVRLDILDEVHNAASGHIGGAFSAVEIVVALYFRVMGIPGFSDPDRDRFVLSKGHASALLYSVLSLKGAFPREELSTYRKLGSRLQGHPDMKRLPGVEMSTGSLGLGVSTAVGMALAAKLDGRDSRVYALLGDGELAEGVVWEAFMASSHYKLDNLVAIVDNNNLQIDGKVTDVMNPYPIDKKLESFGFFVQTVDGLDFDALLAAFGAAGREKGRPSAIIAKTIKGKGVDFMENNAAWHGKAPSREEYEAAKVQLEGNNE
jgi:transketolase